MSDPVGGLEIRVGGESARFDSGRTVTIGRGPDCDIQVDDAAVSRRHASVEQEGPTWVLRDDGSTQGIFVDGARVSRVELHGPTRISLGPPPGAPVIEALPEGAEPETHIGTADRDAGTVMVGHPVAVTWSGGSRTFDSPDSPIGIGRAADNMIEVNEPSVSRHHGVLTFADGSWRYVDSGSSTGSYHNGARVEVVPVGLGTEVNLGALTGPTLTLTAADTPVAPGVADPTPGPGPRRHRLLAISLAGLVAVVAIGLGVLTLLRDDDGAGADELAQATVRISTDTGVSGSGTVVDAERGLVLTNAHVVAPNAVGLAVANLRPSDEDEPRELLVAIAAGLGQPAEPRYRADVVAVDGYLDLAVIRLTRTETGELIEEGQLDELVALAQGPEESLQTAEGVRVFGYPGVAATNEVSLSDGVVSSGSPDARLGDNRAYVNVSAQINAGNSGGLAADDRGRIVGVPTLVRTSVFEGDSPIGVIRPIRFAAPLIEAARTETEYESPYVTPLGESTITDVRLAAPMRSGFELECGGAGGSSPSGSALAVEVDYENFRAGSHQDVLVKVFPPGSDSPIGLAASGDQWPIEFEESGCMTITLELIELIPPGAPPEVVVWYGPSYEKSAALETTVAG